MSKFTFYILQVLLALCTGCMALPPETVPLFPELERQQINAAADGEIFSLREERIAEAEAGEASKEYALSEISIPDSTDEDVIPVTGSGSAILPVNTVHKISATIPVPPEEIVSSSRQGWIPPGFEALNEPQLMEVDVWYGGYYLTSALARFTFDDLTFIQPDLLTGSIPNLATSIDEFEALLSQTFATNSALACRSAFETECGNLSTEDVGIIFDRANFRVSLFVGPRHLGVIESRTSRYLPDSSAEFATVMDNNLFFSGSSNTSLAFNLNNQTQFSIAENRLLLRSNLTNTDGFVFDTVGLQRNYRGKDFQLGLVRGNAAGFEFMNSQHFIGFSYGTS